MLFRWKKGWSSLLLRVLRFELRCCRTVPRCLLRTAEHGPFDDSLLSACDLSFGALGLVCTARPLSHGSPVAVHLERRRVALNSSRSRLPSGRPKTDATEATTARACATERPKRSDAAFFGFPEHRAERKLAQSVDRRQHPTWTRRTRDFMRSDVELWATAERYGGVAPTNAVEWTRNVLILSMNRAESLAELNVVRP